MLRKLFISFWLTVAAVALVVLMAEWQLRAVEARTRATFSDLVASARVAAEAWERGDRTVAAAALAGRTANVLDASGNSIASMAVTPVERRVAALSVRSSAAGFAGPFGDARLGIIAETFASRSGRRYTVVAPSRISPVLWLMASRLAPAIVIALALLLGAIASFVLARHFAKPLTTLGSAVNAVADGDLEARVAPRLGRRRDEIGTLAQDFNRMADRIQTLVSGERRLLGEVSHELRSPLARLTVALSLERRKSGSSEYLDRIERESQRLDLLVGQLLTLARIESGVDVARRDVDLVALLEEIVADGDFEARGSGRSVVLETTTPCAVRANPELLRSAIENVVRNAIRHTAPATAVTVALQTTGDRIHIAVRDRGDGLPDDLLDRVFDPFCSGSGGPGLGLAIAERVVRMHRGSITATNVEGGGLQIEIEFDAGR